MNQIIASFSEHQQVIAAVADELMDAVGEIGQLIADALKAGGTIYWCGNGGSAADSQHLAAELVGRFNGERRALRSIALSTDSSVLTCVANDYGFESIFSRQVEALGRAGDVLVGISTSGNSGNVLKALNVAKTMGLKTVAFLGNDGGRARSLADYAVVVPSNKTARIQEAHILIGHCLCEFIEEALELT